MIKPNSSSEIRELLIEQLSSSLKVSIDKLDPDTPFSRYGLDSVDAITLVVDLEEQLGVDLPQTLLWDYPTVDRCVSYLVTKCPATKSPHINSAVVT